MFFLFQFFNKLGKKETHFQKINKKEKTFAQNLLNICQAGCARDVILLYVILCYVILCYYMYIMLLYVYYVLYVYV